MLESSGDDGRWTPWSLLRFYNIPSLTDERGPLLEELTLMPERSELSSN